MPQPHPGQEWKHGWIPITPSAAQSKNHGRKPGRNSALSRLVEEAAAVHKRMQQDHKGRDHKGETSKPSAGKAGTSTAKPKPAPEKAAPAKAPSAGKATKPGGKPGAKVGTDSHGKTLRHGDEVRLTGGRDQGKNGRVVGRGPSGQVRVEVDGHETTVHSMNVRNRADHENAKAADSAIRKAAGRPSGAPQPQPGSGGHATIPQIQSQVTDAYNSLAKKKGEWVGLDRLRERLSKDLPKDRVDEALRDMLRQSNVRIIPENNQKAITQAARDAAVIIGGQPKHVIAIY